MNAKNIGFISFRFAGTDGVSLETAKWAKVLEDLGFNTFYMAGELDTPPEKSFLEEKLHFTHPLIKEIYNESFSLQTRPPALTDKINETAQFLKKRIDEFVKAYSIDILIPQNALTIPLNIPMGLALTQYIAETGIHVIAHHHDFFWERKRFLNNCIWDYINMCYPPHLPTIEHVVINTSAQNQLALRTGISATLIPNVMNFEEGPPEPDDYIKNVREDLGVEEDELFILQPTRVVQRKGIEHAIELVARLKRKAALVISHASGDEGYEYQTRVKEFADMMNVRALFEEDLIKDERGTTEDGRKIYVLEDIYPHADLVTYPSLIEGFGNAFLETIWFRKPILVNNYSIYSTDIKPKGFKVIEMDNFISQKTIDFTKQVLDNTEMASEMAEINYKLGLKYFSFSVLRNNLFTVLMRQLGDFKPENCK